MTRKPLRRPKHCGDHGDHLAILSLAFFKETLSWMRLSSWEAVRLWRWKAPHCFSIRSSMDVYVAWFHLTLGNVGIISLN